MVRVEFASVATVGYMEGVIQVPNYAKILKERGMSIGEFAKAVGFSKTYVADVLAGRREVPAATEERILAGFDTCHWCKQGHFERPKVVRTKRKTA
jgi:predicted transcriptional regulator